MTTQQDQDPGDHPRVDQVTLDLYKLAVEMADRVSARRAAANTFFVTIHTSLAAIVGVIGAVDHSKSKSPDGLTFGVLAAVGFALAITWWVLLRYYRRLNSAKFEVITGVESRLPLQIFNDEWKVLHPTEQVADQNSNDGRVRIWLRKKKHREASLVEQIIPVIFAAIYLILGLRVVL